jgi:hypothetical protein
MFLFSKVAYYYLFVPDIKSDKPHLNMVILKINIFLISSEKNLSTAECYGVGGA